MLIVTLRGVTWHWDCLQPSKSLAVKKECSLELLSTTAGSKEVERAGILRIRTPHAETRCLALDIRPQDALVSKTNANAWRLGKFSF